MFIWDQLLYQMFQVFLLHILLRYSSLVASTSAVDWLERLISETICYVLSAVCLDCSIIFLARVSDLKFGIEHTCYSASLWANSITEALRCGTHFQGITQFYLLPIHLSMNGMNHTCLWLPSRSCFSFIDPEGIEGWVGLGTTMVSKQSAQDCCVTEITVISCSDRHASPGNWKCSRPRVWNSWRLVP